MFLLVDSLIEMADETLPNALYLQSKELASIDIICLPYAPGTTSAQLSR